MARKKCSVFDILEIKMVAVMVKIMQWCVAGEKSNQSSRSRSIYAKPERTFNYIC